MGLSELVRRVAAREGRNAPAIGVEVADALQVQAEPELLARALANLLRNAIRYGGGSAISIRARAQDAEILLSVADAGPGVPPAALHQIFDPFFRLKRA